MARRRSLALAVSEDDLQRAVVEYIELAHPTLWPVTFHTPSGLAARSRTQVRRFIGLGFKAGVPDLLILSLRRRQDVPARYYGGLALELKAGTNTPTEKQAAFLRALRAHGYFAMWTADFDVAISAICAYAELPGLGDERCVRTDPVLLLASLLVDEQ